MLGVSADFFLLSSVFGLTSEMAFRRTGGQEEALGFISGSPFGIAQITSGLGGCTVSHFGVTRGRVSLSLRKSAGEGSLSSRV